MLSVNLHCPGSKVAAVYPAMLYHLGSPEKKKKFIVSLYSKGGVDLHFSKYLKME